jgi:23S rRNA pseudouridine955/2504/2580 synthase
MTSEQEITVDKDDNGQRVDRWLKSYMPYGLAQKLIRKGAVRVDGKKVKQDTKLLEGQKVRIPPIELKEKKSNYKIGKADEQFIRSLVVFKDEDVIVINKPPELAVQGGTNTKRHVDGLMEVFTTKKGVKPRIVHRLDKDTSGLLIMARNAEAARKLSSMFKTGKVKKIYWAITVPAPEQNEGSIVAPLIKAGGAQKERVIVDDKEGKRAVTDFIILDHLAKKAAFVCFWPRTGRTHQIRVHAADVLNCPVLGDGKYGGAGARVEGIELPFKLHLHARQLKLPHPIKPKEFLDLKAPLPEFMEESFKALGFDISNVEDPFD